MPLVSSAPGLAPPERRAPHTTASTTGSASRIVVGAPVSRPDIQSWLSRAHHPKNPERFIREYPQAFAPSSRAVFVTELDEAGPRSHATLLPARLRCGEGMLDVAMISHVYTAPAARGEGGASRVLQAAHQTARRLGLGLSILWSDRPTLYERLGYTAAGTEQLLSAELSVLESASAGADDKLSLDRPQRDDWNQIARLRAIRSSGIKLDESVLLASREIPDLETRVARRGQEVVAFAMLGRGDDFRGVLHEWAGPTDAVLACCLALVRNALAREANPPTFSLLSPGQPSELTSLLKRAGAQCLEQPLAQMRVLDAHILRSQLSTAFPLASFPDTGDWALADCPKETLDELFIWGLESI